MTTPVEYASRIVDKLPLVKSGTLRIWGEWFGRPYDNIHSIIGASADLDCLILHFDGGETLSIHHPDLCVFNESVFRIGCATRVRWEWYYYGKDRLPENLRYLDYVMGSEGWILQTNSRHNKTSNQLTYGPAIELL